jgi:hypothetical protein
LTVTERRYVVGAVLKLAVTVTAAVIVNAQVVLVPLQAPPQPRNEAPAAGVAVSVTFVEGAMLALQALPPIPQLMRAPLTVPPPVTLTESG